MLRAPWRSSGAGWRVPGRPGIKGDRSSTRCRRRRCRRTRTAPAAVTGRGGTCFRPVLVRANELAADGLVHLADGRAPGPCELCVRPRMPVLWVLTADGVAPDASHLPGRKPA
ncbi:VWA-like domain-containing protein [Actinoplanes campanulatus]|uniref:VWA-like domain-containing protein n=1 Tax=Actinoplanes campanulatus TaxID=113559 RepID=UPI0023B28AEB|nr:VWA-like domain-containing protein [Actinoplanes capillaceus]